MTTATKCKQVKILLLKLTFLICLISDEFCTVGSVCTHYSLFLNEPMLILLLTQAKAQVLPVVISLSRSVD